MKIAVAPHGNPSPASGAVGVGDHSLNISRQVAGARTKLADKGLSRAEVDLADLAWVTGQTSFATWNGTPVPLRVLYHAREFVRQLPVSAPVPTPTTSDQGLLSFSWSGAHARHLVVTISEDGMLVYGGRLGPRRRISGAEPLTGELPATIRQALSDVIG